MSDTDLADNHYRIVDGDRLMWSGRATTWESDPRRFVRALKADIAQRLSAARPVEVEHIWTGVLGNTLHRMPQIGELSPRLWLASGFGGHGLNTTAMAGNIIARAIAEGDDTWRLFLPFELVWAGGASARVRRCILVVRLQRAQPGGARRKKPGGGNNLARPLNDGTGRQKPRACRRVNGREGRSPHPPPSRALPETTAVRATSRGRVSGPLAAP